MKVALFEPSSSAGMRIIRGALKEHGISYVSVASASRLDDTITHTVAEFGGVRRNGASAAGMTHMVLRPANILGAWFFEPEGGTPRIKDIGWFARLLPPADTAQRDMAVASAIGIMGGPGAATMVTGSVMRRCPEDGRLTLLVANSLRDTAVRLNLKEIFNLEFVSDTAHGNEEGNETGFPLDNDSVPIEILFRNADAVLCQDTPLLYESLRRGFKPVVVGDALCSVVGCVHAAPTDDALMAGLLGDAVRSQLNYEEYCAFETYVASVLCVEAIRDTPASRAEAVRRLGAPDRVPPLRLEAVGPNKRKIFLQICGEFLRTPGPWVGDACFILEQRIRRIVNR
ncbi:MAG: hypothetical protein ACPGQM_03135 [Alphaproteobacteria bacterium]